METPKFEKKPDVEGNLEEKKETTIEVDAKTVEEISSTSAGKELLKKAKRAVAMGSVVLLSFAPGAFAQEQPEQDDLKAAKKELIKIIGKEHKEAEISKIFNIHGEKDSAYLIQVGEKYKLVVPGTGNDEESARSWAYANALGFFKGIVKGVPVGFRVESYRFRENKKESTVTGFATVPIDNITVDGKSAIDKLLK